ncbi:hypothetical protein MRX96_039880 [Rhipicephalus microplus]
MWPWYPKLMVLMKFLVQYMLPLAIIGTFYGLMARQLIRTSRANLTQPGCGGVAQLKQMKARVKVAKIALAFVIPLRSVFFPKPRIMGYVMTFVNSCLNPIALYLVSGVFRNHFKHYLFCSRRAASGIHSRNNSYSFRTIHSSSMSKCTASTKI